MEVYNENSNKMLLINIPYTGSSSRVECCRKFMGLKQGEKWFLREKHSKLEDLEDLIKKDNYEIVIFVRNPYEIFISNFIRFNLKTDEKTESEIKYEISKWFKINKWKKFIGFKQSDFFKINNKLKLKENIYYYENLEKDWKKACDKCNLPSEKLNILNPKELENESSYLKEEYLKTEKLRYDNRGNHNKYLNKEQKKLIYEHFKEDFINFNYESDLD
jgi:hypothetical protein